MAYDMAVAALLLADKMADAQYMAVVVEEVNVEIGVVDETRFIIDNEEDYIIFMVDDVAVMVISAKV